jgi:hypothetical protein
LFSSSPLNFRVEVDFRTTKQTRRASLTVKRPTGRSGAGEQRWLGESASKRMWVECHRKITITQANDINNEGLNISNDGVTRNRSLFFLFKQTLLFMIKTGKSYRVLKI